MRSIRVWLAWSTLAFSTAIAQGQAPPREGYLCTTSTGASSGMLALPQTAPPPGLPLEEMPAEVRESIRKVTEQPTLSTRGPVEDFLGRSVLYQWLLDHPDRAAAAWHRLGAPCLEITDRGSGKFGWSDSAGSDLSWETVYRSPGMRVWYAEGKACPGLLLPAVPVKAVVVLRHVKGEDADRAVIRHQADLFMQTDSKTAILLARLIGTQANRLSLQCVSQLEMFFSALVRYVDHHPEKARELFARKPAVAKQ